MKFILSFLALCSFYVASAWAQASSIGAPAPGANIELGSQFTVQIDRPNSIEGSIEVGIAIGILYCPTSEEASCPDPSGQLGDILYTGPFAPTLHPMAQFYENFTLTAPTTDDGFSTGRAQVAVARLHLIGAGPAPILEINSVLNMVN